MDDEDQGVSSQNSEEFHRNVAPKKNNLMGVLNLLKDGRSNCEPAEDEDQGHVTSSDAAASDEQLAPISKPWEFDGTNKRKFKLTTKQLRRMFSPRKLSGHNATSSRRSTARASDELTEDFDHEELSSFTSEDNDEWIEEFVHLNDEIPGRLLVALRSKDFSGSRMMTSRKRVYEVTWD